MANGAWLYYAGLALVIGGVLVGIVALIIFSIQKKRLDARLTREYGPKQ